jgi:hypothetical protein
MRREHLCPNQGSRRLAQSRSCEFSWPGVRGLAASCVFLCVFAYVRKMKTKIPILRQKLRKDGVPNRWNSPSKSLLRRLILCASLTRSSREGRLSECASERTSPQSKCSQPQSSREQQSQPRELAVYYHHWNRTCVWRRFRGIAGCCGRAQQQKMRASNTAKRQPLSTRSA